MKCKIFSVHKYQSTGTGTTGSIRQTTTTTVGNNKAIRVFLVKWTQQLNTSTVQPQ